MEESNKNASCTRGCWKGFCVTLFCKKHLVRDIIILTLLVVSLGAILGASRRLNEKNQRVAGAWRENVPVEQLSEQEAVNREEQEVPVVQAEIDTSAWTPYQNTWYGFSLKYPSDWQDPALQKPVPEDMWEQKINFRANKTDAKNPFSGFDVEVYEVQKVKELANTDEAPTLKSEDLKSKSECATFEGHLIETGDYPAEEIYIPITDACYNATLLFTNTRDNYIYMIIPRLKDGAGLAGDPSREIESHMPEFFAVAKNWQLIDIRRPKPALAAKPAPAKPKITAPKPVSYKTVNGRLVCAKSNDKPSVSKKNKGKHLDMECCLDPDETPNPWCYYDPKKYGKYL